MARAVDGLASKPYPGGQVRQGLDLLRVVCEYEDVFPDELTRLPPKMDIDFCIEIHPGTSPISLTPHRMALVEL